jgi:hypothetical protein
MAYPDNPTYAEKRAAKEFYNALAHLLPCPVCRSHFREVLTGAPIDSFLDNRTSLTEWVWKAHNSVNTKLGKPTITLAAFYDRYRQMADRGLPIPPSNPEAELSDAAVQAAWIRGAATTVGALAIVGAVGGLLWVSYKQN